MFVLLMLSTLALAGGTALASRFYRESRAERALAGIVLALFVIHGSTHLLGWTDRLTPSALGGLASLLSALMFVAGVARDPRGPARAADALVDLVRLPLQAVRLTWHERSPAVLGAIGVPFVAALSLYFSFLAASSSWDGLWYHEPMVGWALAHHGFALVDVPTGMEWVNGYPRFAENLMLWACAFWDRRFIDGVPSVMGLVAWLGLYVLARRVTRSRAIALGVASVVVTIPAAVLQMRSTYIDLIVLAAFLPALHFSTRGWGTAAPEPTRPFRRVDAWMTGIAIGCYASTKSNAPLFASFLLLAALASTIGACRRERSLRVLVHALAALTLMLALVAPTYLRNWEVHHNPVWPLRVHVEAAGIDFVGPSDFGNMQTTFSENLTEMYGRPAPPGQDYYDTRHHAYGYGLTYLGIPLFFVAFFLTLVRWLGGVVSRDAAKRRDAAQLLAFFWLTVPIQLASPSHHWGRYSLPFPALCLVIVAGALARGRSLRLIDGALGAMLVLNLVVLAWADPGWDVSYTELQELRDVAPSERPHVRVGNQIYEPEFMRLRDETLGPADLVVFSDDISFVSNLWDERMDNQVEYVPFHGAADFRARIAELAPTWVAVRPGRGGDTALRDPSSGYHELMIGHAEEATIFARGASAVPAAASPESSPSTRLDPPIPASEIGLDDRDAHRVDLASLRGRVAAVVFWTSWVEPSEAALADLEGELGGRHESGLEVIAVSEDSSEANVAAFLARVPLTCHVVWDERHEVADRYGLSGMPTIYLVDRAGMIRYRHGGFRAADAPAISDELRALLNEAPPAEPAAE